MMSAAAQEVVRMVRVGLIPSTHMISNELEIRVENHSSGLLVGCD